MDVDGLRWVWVAWDGCGRLEMGVKGLKWVWRVWDVCGGPDGGPGMGVDTVEGLGCVWKA